MFVTRGRVMYGNADNSMLIDRFIEQMSYDLALLLSDTIVGYRKAIGGIK